MDVRGWLVMHDWAVYAFCSGCNEAYCDEDGVRLVALRYAGGIEQRRFYATDGRLVMVDEVGPFDAALYERIAARLCEVKSPMPEAERDRLLNGSWLSDPELPDDAKRIYRKYLG